jgi:hypothetical protein
MDRQIKLLKSLEEDADRKVHAVIFNGYDGPKFLPVLNPYKKLILRCLNTGWCLFGKIGSYSDIEDSLKDLFYFHLDERESFFKRMSMIDPIGKGNCGFHVFQLFGMYLEQDDKGFKKNQGVKWSCHEHK